MPDPISVSCPSSGTWPARVISLLAVGLATWVGLRQAHVNREHLRWNLYQCRFAVYEISVRLCQLALDPKRHESEEMFEAKRKFVSAKLESKFLFHSNADVCRIMDNIYKTANHMIDIQKNLDMGREYLNTSDISDSWEQKKNIDMKSNTISMSFKAL